MSAHTDNETQRVGSFPAHGDVPLQLGLSLSGGRGEGPAPSALPSCRFTKQGLVVDNGGVRRVYGFWSTMFGCWETDLVTGRAREVIPKEILLDDRAIRFYGGSQRLARVRARVSRRDGKARFEQPFAMAAFLSDVPAEIRQRTGSFGSRQWLALDLIWQVPGFAEFLETETSLARLQYVHACLAMADAGALSRAGRARLGRAIMSDKRANLLAELSGQAWPKSAIAALYKLEAGELEASAYRNLARAMTVPSAAKVLGHVRNIQSVVPGVLLRLPPALHLTALVSLVGENPECHCALLHDIRDVLGDLPREDRPRSVQALARVRHVEAFGDWCRRSRSVAIDRRAFPPPPFPGDERMQPLTDNESLRREGNIMGNCGADYAPDVRDGAVYLYHWAGEEPATVMLEDDAERGWILAEALGAYNEILSPWTQCLIEERIWLWRFHLLGVRGDPTPRIPEVVDRQTMSVE